MLKGLHSILRNIQGGKVGTFETPFRLLCTVYSNSSIIENKMHTEAVCVCVLLFPTCIQCPHKYNSNLMGIFFRSL